MSFVSSKEMEHLKNKNILPQRLWARVQYCTISKVSEDAIIAIVPRIHAESVCGGKQQGGTPKNRIVVTW